jgi:hypothetical protein
MTEAQLPMASDVDEGQPGVKRSVAAMAPARPLAVRRRRALVVLLVTGMALAATGCDATPDTPENAVMDFLTSRQVGKDDDASKLLCRRLQDTSDQDELDAVETVVGSSVFGDGLIEEDDDSAIVRLDVRVEPSPAATEPWEAHLVNEDGRWKVCGFEPVG